MRAVGGKEPTLLRVQAEQHAVEHDQGVLEREGEALRRALVPAQQSARDPRDGAEHLLLEALADGDGVLAAPIHDPVVQEADPGERSERGRREQRGEEPERLHVRGLQDGDEVDVQAGAVDEVAFGRVQAPVTAVGENAPARLGDREVVDDLRHRILAEGASAVT